MIIKHLEIKIEQCRQFVRSNRDKYQISMLRFCIFINAENEPRNKEALL